MFDTSALLFIYVETPLHAGSGQGLGGVDLPIQRERVTSYPIVQASSLKGRLRAEADPDLNPKSSLQRDEFAAIFGNAAHYAGALSPGDARILLFPVRSLAGVFAWTTSRAVLERFRRDLAAAQEHALELSTPYTELCGYLDAIQANPPEPHSDDAERWALVGQPNLVTTANKVVLEEFSFTPETKSEVTNIGKWVARHALPPEQQAPEYKFWRESLAERLVILPEDDFRDFVRFATEIATRVALNEKKTVEQGPWTEESLPTDTLLYAPLLALATRATNGVKLSGVQVLEKVKGLNLKRTQLGGDETVGRGTVYLHFWNGKEGSNG